ncbi:MAG: DUF3145 domain-containing protein [Actinomycetes bacterium]
MTTHGVVYVHAAPPALAPHVQWALAGVLGMPVDLDWSPQPAEAGTLRAEVCWQGAAGTAARIASALRGWARLRFEVTEDPAAEVEGARFSYTPTLGMFHALIGSTGDILLPEQRLRAALEGPMGSDGLGAELDRLLGGPWDDELEPFRYAGDGAPVRWLHQVG